MVHDSIFQENPEAVPNGLKWEVLIDESTEYNGFKIYGSPWQPTRGDWAFNANEDQREAIWAKIPNDIDILLLHGPPFGIGDDQVNGIDGCVFLLNKIMQIKPKLTVCGHIHSGRGTYEQEFGSIINAAMVDDNYRLIHKPITLDMWITKEAI